MNWKYINVHCPSCGFRHDFKRICWWEPEGLYIGLYGSDDMKSRKDCQQELFYGEGKYEQANPYLNRAAMVVAHEKHDWKKIGEDTGGDVSWCPTCGAVKSGEEIQRVK